MTTGPSRSPIASFRKKPVVIEALQFTGKNHFEVGVFLGYDAAYLAGGELVIRTLEDGKDGAAKHIADPGDWIIKGVKGEFYPCKPEIFALTYESADRPSEMAQQMSTAPKDGTPVLAWVPTYYRGKGSWVVALWMPEKGMRGEGWMDNRAFLIQPSIWLPLPKVPTECERLEGMSDDEFYAKNRSA